MKKKENLETKVTTSHKCFLYGFEVDCRQEPTPETCEKCKNMFWEM